MTQLPEDYIKYTRQTMGDELFQRYRQSFLEPAPVSIRLNPLKAQGLVPVNAEGGVPWCRDGYYLTERPQFTFDPLLHAGCYYVQEAASMFLDTVLRQYLPQGPVTMLDLCAAPGGKSTLARAVLPEGSVLYTNEPVPGRAAILAENIQKWGYDGCVVTNNLPADYRKSKLKFDVILCDVPCSGEGMFRKDEASIGQWSMQNVERCWQLQRAIVTDAYNCLSDGGLLIYSTCTFNTKENEENIRWMLNEFDLTALPVDTMPEWNITGSLLPGFTETVYRFIPGVSKGEGLFLCVMRKSGESLEVSGKRNDLKQKRAQGLTILSPLIIPDAPSPISELRLPNRSLSHHLSQQADLGYKEAMAYLRGEAIVLPPDTPRGLVTVTFQGFPLGTVKNIGTRANNLYPKGWRIKTTHIPQDYNPILKTTYTTS